MGGKEASKVSFGGFGDRGTKGVYQNLDQQTKTQLEGLRGEIAGELEKLGITDPSLVDIIVSHPWLLNIILRNYNLEELETLKKGEKKEIELKSNGFTLGKLIVGREDTGRFLITLTFNREILGVKKVVLTIAKTPENNYEFSLSLRNKEGRKKIKKVTVKVKNNGSLRQVNWREVRKLIQTKLSIKLDGERVWIYQVTTGKETETEEKEKGWRFRIPPGLRESNPDLARFFDLSNKFNIDARLWIENPEEAAKQFN